MKIYRYKFYDFEKDMLPIGKEWKDPEVVAEVSPGEDYEIFEDRDYLDALVADKYKQNEAAGKDYTYLVTAKIANMVGREEITIAEAEEYGILTEKVRGYLREGYWHSAYFGMLVEPSSKFLSLHEEIKTYIKNYIKLNYETIFHID